MPQGYKHGTQVLAQRLHHATFHPAASQHTCSSLLHVLILLLIALLLFLLLGLLGLRCLPGCWLALATCALLLWRLLCMQYIGRFVNRMVHMRATAQHPTQAIQHNCWS